MDNKYFWGYCFPMKKGNLDNEYYFYEDGRILHIYDKTQNKLNIEEDIKAKDISERERKIILDNCPEKHINKIKKILGIDGVG